jgi:hypothetical protein
MNGAVRDCLVEGYEPLVEVLELPDPDDRHVLQHTRRLPIARGPGGGNVSLRSAGSAVPLGRRWFPAAGIRHPQVILGPAAAQLAFFAIFVMLDFPSAGGTISPVLLPTSQGVGTDALKLLAWLGVGVVLLALPIWRKTGPGLARIAAQIQPLWRVPVG